MKKVAVLTVIFILLIFTIKGESLTLSVSSSIPPYFIKENRSGMQLEIMERAFEEVGDSIEEIEFVPNKRAEFNVLNKKTDIAVNVPHDYDNLFYSDVILYYENVAITLKRKEIKINKINDLKNKEITAFQNAVNLLGERFRLIVEDDLNYKEISDQSSQVYQLYLDRTDVIISDINVFYYHKDKIEERFNFSDEIDIHRIFGKMPRTAAFSSKELRDKFNRGLKIIKEKDVYNEILNKYRNEK